MTELPAIEAVGLVKRYGAQRALDGVDLDVPRGAVCAMLGPNGAGKTTAVRILTTLTRPDEGSAQVAGHDVLRDPVSVRRSLGLAAQDATVDGLLTGRENLEMIGELHHLGRRPARERAAVLLEQFSLVDASSKLAKEYSGGMRRRLDLAATLVARPEVLFLDEPTTGLDPRARNELWGVLDTLVGQGTTVLLTTQYLEEVTRAMGEITGGRPSVDLAERSVTSPTDGGAGAIAALASALVDAGVQVDDLGLRQPTLDDVFLTLTGASPEFDDDGALPTGLAMEDAR